MVDQHPFWKPKFTVAAYVLLTATAALFAGKIDQEVFKGLSEMVFGAFAIASVAENTLLKPKP